jgi:hypothetical protein
VRSSRVRSQQHERQFDVLFDRQVRQDVERLEHESELASPRQRAAGVVERGKVRAVDFDAPRVRAVQPGDQVEQRGLPRARLADDRDVLARSDPERQLVENRARPEPLREGVDREHEGEFTGGAPGRVAIRFGSSILLFSDGGPLGPRGPSLLLSCPVVSGEVCAGGGK